MNRSQRLNLNESLLYHNLIRSQASLSKVSFKKKPTKKLMSELNMTYSWLTMQTKTDHLKENKALPETRYLLTNDQQTHRTFLPQSNQSNCPNCGQLQKKIKDVQKFMIGLEDKIIQRELLLSSRFQQLSQQLLQKAEQLKTYQSICQKYQLQDALERAQPTISKLSFQTSRKPTQLANSFPQSVSTNVISMEKKGSSTKDKFTPSIKENQKKCKRSSKISQNSSFNFSYTSSQAENSEFLNSKREKSGKTATLGSQKVHALTHRACSFSRLQFENSNLKSYNSVLLEHSKPRSLVSKIFNSSKN